MLTATKIPIEMRDLPQWVVWKYVDRKGRPTKCPFQPDGVEAKSNDPSTWSRFAEAQATYDAGGYEGVGFMFSESDPYCGIDLDGCRDPESGVTNPWAREWLVKFHSYCEVSPSGSGWKIFCRGKNKFDTGKKHDLAGEAVGGKKPGVEIYDHVRWFAVTGLRGKFSDLEECQPQIDEFCDAYWKPTSHRSQAGVLDGEIFERARRYLAKVPPAVSGQSGHNTAFTTACVLVLGFGLTPEQAYPLFAEWNQTCVPPWSEREVWHKLNSANKQVGDRFYLRNAQESQWDQIQLPTYAEQTPPAQKAAPAVTQREFVFTPLDNAALNYLNALENSNPLIDMGIPELNHALGGGVERGEMVILAARPSHGKSAFALQCLHTFAEHNLSSLMVSEEMSALALGRRTLQYVTGVPQERWLQDKCIVERHIEMHFRRRAKIHIVENCRTARNVDAAIKKAVQEHGATVVAVDYAQMILGDGKTKYDQTSATSVALRHMANEHNVLLLALCQLNRDVESRDKFMPKMVDLRDSGQLEQDADVIVFLVWPHRLNPDKNPFEYQLFVAKNRNRPINKPALTIRFEAARQQFKPEESAGTAWRNGTSGGDCPQPLPEFQGMDGRSTESQDNDRF